LWTKSGEYCDYTRCGGGITMMIEIVPDQSHRRLTYIRRRPDWNSNNYIFSAKTNSYHQIITHVILLTARPTGNHTLHPITPIDRPQRYNDTARKKKPEKKYRKQIEPHEPKVLPN
jgi:hypothetical protein